MVLGVVGLGGGADEAGINAGRVVPAAGQFRRPIPVQP